MLLTGKVPLFKLNKWAPLVGVINFLTCVAAYLIYYFYLSTAFELPGLVATVLGTALAFFIGFSNNQAYDRWWEARKIWGSLVNNSRTWARQIIYSTQDNKYLNEKDLNSLRKKMIYRHIAFIYALKETLRKTGNKEYHKFLSETETESLLQQSNIPNAILNFQYEDLNDLYKNKCIDGFQYTEINDTLMQLCNGMGISERIKNTVFPPMYHFFTRTFILFFLIAVVFSTADVVGFYSIFLGLVIGFVFSMTHIIGMILVKPFEDLVSGIPLDSINRTIEINLLESLNEETPPVIKSLKGVYIT
jgi:ion channel-forming bestrophin family protein